MRSYLIERSAVLYLSVFSCLPFAVRLTVTDYLVITYIIPAVIFNMNFPDKPDV